MSTVPGSSLFDKLKELVEATADDYTKSLTGVKLAGTRVRNNMQDIRQLALDIRKEVLTVRKAKAPAKPTKSAKSITQPTPPQPPAPPAAKKSSKK